MLAIQDLTRDDFKIGDKLPTVFSMVFYNGEAAWNVSTSLLEMLRLLEGTPEGLDFWSYKLIDAQRLDLEERLGGPGRRGNDSTASGKVPLDRPGVRMAASEIRAGHR